MTATPEVDERERRITMALLFVVPMLFATNVLMARAMHDQIPPVAFAFWRWLLVFALLLPLVGGSLWRNRYEVQREWLDLLILGTLGMGFCGAFVYIGAQTTTATNMGLIYAAAPIGIVAMASLIYGEALHRGQLVGMGLSLTGVLVIVFRGDLEALERLQFVPGDIWIAVAAAAWALYSVMLRYRKSALPPQTRLAAIALFGVTVLLPFHILEAASGDVLDLNTTTIIAIIVVAVVPGLGAYQGYARIQRTLGAGPTALVLYLQPVYNATAAWLLLGEELYAFHFAGAALILPGIFLTTRKR